MSDPIIARAVAAPAVPGQDPITVSLVDTAGQPIELGGTAPAPTWASITGKPATFPPTIGTTATTAKAGNYTPTAAEVSAALKAKSQIAALAAVATDADGPTLAAAINAVVAALKA